MKIDQENCRRGHPRTEENTKIDPKTGAKVCVLCRRLRQKARQYDYKKPSDFKHCVRHNTR